MQACCVMGKSASWLMGEEGMRERKGERGKKREPAILFLETIGKSPSIRYLLQRYFPPCFYKQVLGLGKVFE